MFVTVCSVSVCLVAPGLWKSWRRWHGFCQSSASATRSCERQQDHAPNCDWIGTDQVLFIQHWFIQKSQKSSSGFFFPLRLNDSCPSVDGLIVLTTLLSKCPAVKELHIRYNTQSQISDNSSHPNTLLLFVFTSFVVFMFQRLKSGLDPAQVTVVFPGGSRKPAETRTLWYGLNISPSTGTCF